MDKHVKGKKSSTKKVVKYFELVEKKVLRYKNGKKRLNELIECVQGS